MVLRRTTAGAAATGKTSANFTVQGFKDGAAVSLTVDAVTEGATYGPSGNQWRAYQIDLAALPAAVGFNQIFIWPDNSDLVWPDQLAGEIEAYDLTSMAALLLSAQGVPAVQSAADSDLGDIVSRDSYTSPVLTLASAQLVAQGITDISDGGITVQAAIRASSSAETEYPIPTVPVVDGDAYQIRLAWTKANNPLPDDLEGDARTWYVDVQVRKDADNLVITAGRYTFQEVWQRDSREPS